MKRNDYIPAKDSDFDILQNNVYNAVTTNAAQWLIPQQLITDLDPPRMRWNTSYVAYLNPAVRTSAITQEKRNARKKYEAMLRSFIQGQIMHNSQVTNANRRDMGLPVYNRTSTQVPAPKTRTTIAVLFSQVMKHTLYVRDSVMEGPGKPAHTIGFEIWRFVGGTTEPAYEELQFVELATHSPHTLEYESADRGKMVWYASRWVSTRGEKGPWSKMASAIVP
jgi:hypothetical protein